MAQNRSEYFQGNVAGIPERVSLRVRKRQLKTLMDLARPTPATSVLDVGVSLDQRLDSNFFEKLDPYPEKVVALGMEDASFLCRERPGVKFVRADGRALPFADKRFDLVTCFATLEHAGNRTQQHTLVQELCRVGKSVCITTPNRWYPLEFHSLLPLVHWLPPRAFRKVLRVLGQEFFSREANLNLLSEADVEAMFPPGFHVEKRRGRLMGPVSNLFFFLTAA